MFQVIVVSRLPRDALVEWSVVVHKCPDEKLEGEYFPIGILILLFISLYFAF